MTENELLDAIANVLERPSPGGDDAYTINELRTRAPDGSQCPRKIRDGIRALIAQGKAECVWVPRTQINGRVTRTSAYRLRK